MKFVVILCLIALSGINGHRGRPDRNQLIEMFHWDILDFQFPPDRREQAIAAGSYIPSKNGILSLGVWRDKLFAGVFRLTKGVASSLNYFSLNTTDKSPVLIPYPSFEANYVNEDPNNRTVSLPSTSSVINAGHFKIDKCNRLWVVDAGYTDHFGNRRSIAPPAIVIFDLITDTLIRRIEVPQKFVNPVSTFAALAVDFDGDSCEDVYAYVSDFFRSLIVYSFKKDRVWQVEHNFMGSDPHQGNFVFEHLTFQWNYGVHAVVVGDQQPDGSKRIYFAPISSTKIYYVSNRVLQNENYILSKYYNDFHVLGEVESDGHANQMVFDEETETLFNTIFGGSSIGCWNTHKPYQTVNTVHKTTTDFYPVGLTIDSNRNLWIVSLLLPLNSYEKFVAGRKNVRIFKETVKQATAGTSCKARKNRNH